MPPHVVLYDDAGSTNALKVRFLLAELALEYERIPTPLRGAKPAGYRDLHPFELVPVLQVGDDVRITESNVTLRYLAEMAGREDLRGADPVARARVDVVLDSLSLELRPWLWGVEEWAVYGEGDVGEAERAQRLAALEDRLDRFDALLDPTGPYAVGEAFTIADAALAGRLLHLPRLPLAERTAPRLHRAFAAATARPAFAAARG